MLDNNVEAPIWKGQVLPAANLGAYQEFSERNLHNYINLRPELHSG